MTGRKDPYWNPFAFDPFASVLGTIAVAVYLSRSLVGVALDTIRAWLKPHRRPRAIAFFALLIGCVLCFAGCCSPCRSSCGSSCGAPSMPPAFCCPTPTNYGEPMHPIYRKDGAQVLVPHTQFKGWIRDDTPSPTTS